MYNLAVIFPEVAAQWHPTKNIPLTPLKVTPRNHKKVWWLCSNKHEWSTSISNRTRKVGGRCPYCMNKKVSRENSFAIKYPDTAKEWHSSLNDPLTPDKVSPGSNRRVWWQCKVFEEHVWQATVWSRTQGARCAYCIHQKVAKDNCLAVVYPELAKEWHTIKNGTLTPYDILGGSERMVWWKCTKGDDHEWESLPMNRIKGVGCAICAGKKIVESTCLATLRPDIALEWHQEKNAPLTPYHVAPRSNKKMWWRCLENSKHEWRAPINSRTSGFGCPLCSHRIASDETSLASLHPELIAEWHPNKNGELTPKDFTSRSGQKVWWQCLRNNSHEWDAVISNRSKGIGCPLCANEINKSEEKLYLLVCELIKDSEIKRNHKPIFLQGLEYDIYLPEYKLAIEYQGIQHYEAKDFFGGEKYHLLQKERDSRKRRLSLENEITLIEYKYNEEINIVNLRKKLHQLINVKADQSPIGMKSDSRRLKMFLD